MRHRRYGLRQGHSRYPFDNRHKTPNIKGKLAASLAATRASLVGGGVGVVAIPAAHRGASGSIHRDGNLTEGSIQRRIQR